MSARIVPETTIQTNFRTAYLVGAALVGATIWVTAFYLSFTHLQEDVSGLKGTAAEINQRLSRIERRVGVLPGEAVTLSAPTRPAAN